jgi:DNA (cytosine-5)-methyltransferase 1
VVKCYYNEHDPKKAAWLRELIRAGAIAPGDVVDERSIVDVRADEGFWRDADWIACRDGKARPVEPGTFPLAHGTPARVVRLRGYGDAIVASQAAEFIGAVMEEIGEA